MVDTMNTGGTKFNSGVNGRAGGYPKPPTLQERYSPYDNGGLANDFARLWSYGGLGNGPGGDYESSFYDWLPTALQNSGNRDFWSQYDQYTSMPYITPRTAASQAYGSVQPQQPQATGQDDLLSFMLNQLGISGLNQPSPPSQFNSAVGQISGVDVLLAELLGGY